MIFDNTRILKKRNKEISNKVVDPKNVIVFFEEEVEIKTVIEDQMVYGRIKRNITFLGIVHV